ncbi:MAG: FtsQ-type POTRA domain-containing protein [Deltaproteobacteria bacterium]|nr:FtsQ-type POTRA domain-containing protein [Deltaproteobacteria bacterium]
MNKKPLKSKRRNRRHREPFLKRAGRSLARFMKAAVVLAAGSALAYGGWRGYKELTTTERLAIETIEIAGAFRVSEDDIHDLAGIEEGDNILSFRESVVAGKIRRNPWIKEVDVSRGLPSTVTIEVTEREPLALVKLDAMYVMDASGVVFKKYSPGDGLDLPVITGLTADGLRETSGELEEGLLDLMRTLKGREGFNLSKVSEIHADRVFGLSVYTLDEGVRLDVGLQGFSPKLESFEKILKTRGGSLNGIEAMDLNNYREVVVRFSANVVKEGGEAHGKKG